MFIHPEIPLSKPQLSLYSEAEVFVYKTIVSTLKKYLQKILFTLLVLKEIQTRNMEEKS